MSWKEAERKLEGSSSLRGSWKQAERELEGMLVNDVHVVESLQELQAQNNLEFDMKQSMPSSCVKIKPG